MDRRTFAGSLAAVMATGVASKAAAQSDGTPTSILPENAEHMWTRIFVPEGFPLSGSANQILVFIAVEYNSRREAEAVIDFPPDGEFEQSESDFESITDDVILWEETSSEGEQTSMLMIREDAFAYVWSATGFKDSSSLLIDLYAHHFAFDRNESEVLPTEEEVPPGLEIWIEGVE